MHSSNKPYSSLETTTENPIEDYPALAHDFQMRESANIKPAILTDLKGGVVEAISTTEPLVQTVGLEGRALDFPIANASNLKKGEWATPGTKTLIMVIIGNLSGGSIIIGGTFPGATGININSTPRVRLRNGGGALDIALTAVGDAVEAHVIVVKPQGNITPYRLEENGTWSINGTPLAFSDASINQLTDFGECSLTNSMFSKSIWLFDNEPTSEDLNKWVAWEYDIRVNGGVDSKAHFPGLKNKV